MSEYGTHGPRPWHEVKAKAAAWRASLVDELVTAKPDAVSTIQLQIQAIDQFTRWFEAGAPADKVVGSDPAAPGY